MGVDLGKYRLPVYRSNEYTAIKAKHMAKFIKCCGKTVSEKLKKDVLEQSVGSDLLKEGERNTAIIKELRMYHVKKDSEEKVTWPKKVTVMVNNSAGDVT